MNMKAGVQLLIGLAPSLKGWIFADGKFKPLRGLILLGFFVILTFTVCLVGLDNTAIIIEMLDDVSDILGYA